MRFAAVKWSEWSEDHIAGHGVDPHEVQDVLFGRPQWISGGRNGTTLVYGTTRDDRMLLVVVSEEGDGTVFVVTARDMTDSERRTFRRKGR